MQAIVMWHIIDGKWVHIVRSETENGIELYTNGKLEATIDYQDDDRG